MEPKAHSARKRTDEKLGAFKARADQLLAPGFFFMFPDELGPPPFFASFGSGWVSAGFIAGAGASCTSVLSPQPIESPITNPQSTE